MPKQVTLYLTIHNLDDQSLSKFDTNHVTV